MSLLSISADAKTSKGEAQGYLTGVMYLAPSTLAGVGNLCPNASPGCIATCLNTAGRGVFSSVQQGRIRRTLAWKADRAAFMRDLVREVRALVRKAARDGMTPLVRLNGTSDLPWENIGAEGAVNIMALFPDVQFYDYTKSYQRMVAFLAGQMPRNYHLTFSRSEHNGQAAVDVLAAGGNVAVVFDTRRGQALPATWAGFDVIDGDVSDVRPHDPGAFNPANGAASITAAGSIIGLRAKGRARRDTSGFVVAVA